MSNPAPWAPGQYRVVPPKTWGGVWPPARTWTPDHWRAWLSAQGWDDPRIRGYLQARLDHGLGLLRAGSMTQWFYNPTPKGVEFHTAAAPNVLFGGAVGGAKSMSLRWDFYKRCLQVPGSKYLLFRRTFSELQDNHINDARREVALMKEAGMPVEYLADPKYVVFKRGTSEESWIRFAHCESDGDEELYLGSAYEAVGLDELATFLRKQAMRIASRLRSDLPGVTALLRATSNPAGAQTVWVREAFIDHTVGPEQDAAYRPQDWQFVSSRLYDNPYYMDPDGTWTKYERRLIGTGSVRARQLLFGDWSAIEGAFFDFDPQRHVRDLGLTPNDVACLRVTRGLDWGSASPGVVGWHVALPDGHVHTFDELKFQRMSVAQVAEAIRAKDEEWGLITDRVPCFCDPALRIATGQIGEDFLQTFARYGVPLTPVSNDRISGWQRLHEALAASPDGSPWWTIHPRCRYGLRTLPMMVASVVDREDVDTTGDDHWIDQTRYAFMGGLRPGTKPAILAPMVRDRSWGWFKRTYWPDPPPPRGGLSY